MKYKNPDYLARQVRARRGASALGKLAGWNLANYSELIPPRSKNTATTPRPMCLSSRRAGGPLRRLWPHYGRFEARLCS